MGGEDSGRAAVFSGFYKTLQSLAVGILWALDWGLMLYADSAAYSVRYKAQWIIMCFLWVIAFPGTLLTLLRLRKMPENFMYTVSHEASPKDDVPLEFSMGVHKLQPSPGEVSTIVSSSGGIISLSHMEGDFPMRQPTRTKLAVQS
eukprot:Gregarina_sp_Poly_1__3623@NODE_2067_length_2740_cov_256_289188_g45_i2_p3_GENE_NODE_2067_length_2740_cov_256_289188_g45_i2NODE_2067_length_2740_cov_256_289188_g45_i2_p3_ORF_typecomplete_len146_score14_11_NODE_2067_length_2740_cov_256_289188_g45_i221972634